MSSSRGKAVLSLIITKQILLRKSAASPGINCCGFRNPLRGEIEPETPWGSLLLSSAARSIDLSWVTPQLRGGKTADTWICRKHIFSGCILASAYSYVSGPIKLWNWKPPAVFLAYQMLHRCIANYYQSSKKEEKRGLLKPRRHMTQ